MWPFTRSIHVNPTPEASDPTPAVPKYEPPNKSSIQSSTTLTKHKNEKLERHEWLGYQDERLGIIFPLRAVLLMGASFLSGASLGAATGSAVAADRYRAENAHRLPKNTNGWFLYHKSKNYHAMLGGMKEGAKYGITLTSWAFVFMVTEEMIDQSRARIFARRDDERAVGQRDAASTIISAMTIAGVYSWKQGFDQYAAARTAKMALKYSMAFGLAQDALTTLRGNPPAYVEWIAGKTFSSSDDRHKV